MNNGMGQEGVRGYHWSSGRATTRSSGADDVSHKYTVYAIEISKDDDSRLVHETGWIRLEARTQKM